MPHPTEQIETRRQKMNTISQQGIQHTLLTKPTKHLVLIKKLQGRIELKMMGEVLRIKQKNTGIEVVKRCWQLQGKLPIRHRSVMGTGCNRPLSGQPQGMQWLQITNAKGVGIHQQRRTGTWLRQGRKAIEIGPEGRRQALNRIIVGKNGMHQRPLTGFGDTA